MGGTVIYGMANGKYLNTSAKHYELDADSSGYTNCLAFYFGAKNGGSCFCELPAASKHNFCERSSHKEIGCYKDK